MNTPNTPTNTLERHYSDGSELIPAEVAARKRREGSEPPNQPLPKIQEEQNNSDLPSTTSGYTVDQEGLVNNYATPPETYEANYPTPQQQRNYLLWGLAAILFLGGLIWLSFLVS